MPSIESLLIATGTVLVLSGLAWAYDRWFRPRMMRRWIEKTLTKVRAADYVPPPKQSGTGTLEVVDGRVRYRLDGAVCWELPIRNIRVIGEATNDHGPYLDDYFFCFATDANNWYEASFYSEGREQFLESLAQALQCEPVLKLVGETGYDSNVLWPPHLAGMKMFKYKPVQPTTWIGRLFGSWSNTQSFSDEVLAELPGEGRTSPCT